MTWTRRTFLRSTTAAGAFAAVSTIPLSRTLISPADATLSSSALLGAGAQPAGSAEIAEKLTSAGLGRGNAAALPGGNRYMNVSFPQPIATSEHSVGSLEFTLTDGSVRTAKIHPLSHGRDGQEGLAGVHSSEPIVVPEDAVAAKYDGAHKIAAADTSRAYVHVVEAKEGEERDVAGAGVTPYVANNGAGLVQVDPNQALQLSQDGLEGSTALAGAIADIIRQSGLNPGPVLPTPVPGAGKAAVIDGLEVVSRAQWGADESLASWVPNFAPAQVITVHHTAMATTGLTNYYAAMRSIYAYHASSANGGQGWGDIGYHLVIAPDGTVFQGRTTGRAGYAVFQPGTRSVATAGHVYNANTSNVGVCLMGDYTYERPTTQAIDSLVRVLGHLCRGLGLDPRSSMRYTNRDTGHSSMRRAISGHRDWADISGGTGCPGDLMYPMMDSVRSRV